MKFETGSEDALSRDDKHALFAATALHAFLLFNQKQHLSDQQSAPNLIADAVCYADMMMVEIEKEDA